jgi:hypothetical protein
LGGAGKAPNTKHQAPQKHQVPNLKSGEAQVKSNLRCLELLGSLELAAWSFCSSFFLRK